MSYRRIRRRRRIMKKIIGRKIRRLKKSLRKNRAIYYNRNGRRF